MLGAVAVPADADDVFAPAAACMERINYGGAYRNIGTNGQQVFNLSTSQYGYVGCGLRRDTVLSSSTDDLRVYYFDGNPTSGNNVYCYAGATNLDGSAGGYFGSRYACSTAGGCSSNSGGTYTGEGYFEWVNMNLPAYSTISVSCTFYPDAYPSGGYSGIRAFRYIH